MLQALFEKYARGQNPANIKEFLANLMPATFSGSTWVDASQERFEEKRADFRARKHGHAPGEAKRFHYVERLPVRAGWPVDQSELKKEIMFKLQQHTKTKRGVCLFAMFRMFDRENRGFINLAAFQDTLKNLNFDAPEEQITALFADLDSDGDGKISLPEFQKGLMPGLEDTPRRVLKRAIGPNAALDMKISSNERDASGGTPALAADRQMGGGRQFPKHPPQEVAQVPRPPAKQSIDTDTIKNQKAQHLRQVRADRIKANQEMYGSKKKAALTARRPRAAAGNNVFSMPSIQHKNLFKCSTYRG